MVDRNHVPPVEVLRARKRMNDAVRSYFDARGFLEVETPIAVLSPGLEPHLFAFETTEVGPDDATQQLFLHTSPEYAMKRMLGRGVGSIYQIARVFRNGERSATHAPEFTMLEWYREGEAYEAIMADVEGLIAAVAEAVDGWRPAAYARVSIGEAFARAGLADPLAVLARSSGGASSTALRLPTATDTAALRDALGVRAVDDDDWDDVFFRAFLDHVEPTFPEDVVTILYGYPAHMAALARVDPTDPRRAERFEVFVGRTELGNAFGELTDPVEQRARFGIDLEHRRRLGRPAYPIDEGLLRDLANIEAAAGIAMGLDRLLMLCLALPTIQETLVLSPRD